jgi:hypothetical protein
MALLTGAADEITTTTVAAAEVATPVTAASQPEGSSAERSLLGADHYGRDSSYYQGNRRQVYGAGQFAYGECLRHAMVRLASR